MKIRFESRITRITLAAAAALIVGTLPALAVAIPTSIGTNISTTGTLTVGDTSDLQDVTLHDTLNANGEDITNVGELDISGHINLGGTNITNGGTITATTLTDGTASFTGGVGTGVQLNSPMIKTAIYDEDGNQILGLWERSTSAENSLEVWNWDSGNPPGLRATSTTDANVGIWLQPKGTGVIYISSSTLAGSNQLILQPNSALNNRSGIITTADLSDSSHTWTFPNADGTASLSGGALTGLTTALSIAQGGTAATSASGARTSLGLEIDTDVEAWDTDLDDWAGVSTSAKANSGSNSDITELTGLTTALSIGQGGTGATTDSGARTSLGLAIGTNVQAWDADLDTYAGITPSANIQTFLGSADNAAARSNLGIIDRTILDAVGNSNKGGVAKYMSVEKENAVANGVSTPMPYGCTAKNMYVATDFAPVIGTTGSGTGVVVTLENEEVATSVTCTVLYGATTCSDLVNTSVFTPGQKWDIKMVNPSNGTGAINVSVKVGIECDAT